MILSDTINKMYIKRCNPYIKTINCERKTHEVEMILKYGQQNINEGVQVK